MMSCHYIINMTASVVNMQEVDGIIYREKYVKCTGYIFYSTMSKLRNRYNGTCTPDWLLHAQVY